MNDNKSYQEALKTRKKRNQFISVLIIVAIVLVGVIVWGWVELEKSRNAERIKNALNSQVEPGFKEVTDTVITTEIPVDTESLKIEDTVPVPSASVENSQPIEPLKPEVASNRPSSPKPQVSRPIVHKPLTPKTHPKQESPGETAIVSKPVVAEPAKPVPEIKAPSPAVEPVAIAPDKAPVNSPIAPPPPTPPTSPVKAYPPEDLPVPAKAEPSEDARLAIAFTPAPVSSEKPSQESEASKVGSSNSFKQGLAAYRQQDYANATRLFASISKPASKKRGPIEREEYVQGNFLKGVSLLKVGHMSEAVTAFQNVLDYEKYYPLANMNLGICYVEMKQYAKAHQAFEAVIRDQNFIESSVFDDVMQRTKYFWALAWTRLYKNATNPDKQNYYRQQAVLKWKDYDVWFSKNDKYKSENQKAENYLKSLSSL